MGAIVNALHGTSLATGIDPLWLARLSIYWEQVRATCRCKVYSGTQCTVLPKVRCTGHDMRCETLHVLQQASD